MLVAAGRLAALIAVGLAAAAGSRTVSAATATRQSAGVGRVNLTSVDAYGRTPLHLAAARGALAEVEALLAAGAHAEARARYDLTPLHWAAMRGQAAVVERLLAHGVAVDTPDLYGATALHLAGTGAVAQSLVGAGAAIDAADHFGRTPLHLARSGEIARALLDVGANMLAPARDGSRPIEAGAASSAEVFGLALTPNQRIVPVGGGSGELFLTVRSFADHPHRHLRLAIDSLAADLDSVAPVQVASLDPGQLVGLSVRLSARPAVPAGLHAAELRLLGEPGLMMAVPLTIDTRPGSRAGRTRIPIAQVQLNERPRLWQLVIFIAPLLLLGLGWALRRRFSARAKGR